MQFDPLVHTKEYLLSNPDVVLKLAKESAEFAKSEAAKSFEILTLRNKWGETIAHNLAKYQPAWVQSEAAKSLEILKLWSFGKTVAHYLMQNQSEWIYTEAAKNLEILKLADINGMTVGSGLVFYQPQWVHLEAVKNLEILKINSKWGSIARYIAEINENCTNYELFFHKQVLTLEYEGKLLAEEISERYKSKGFDVPVMAIKLISQGAAYRHSKSIAIKAGESILKQCKTLIEDGLDPLVSLKQLQALYSTFSHNISKIISTTEQKSLQKWQGFLIQSENMIHQHLDKHPELLDIDHTIDIFCEPGDDLLKRLMSDRILKADLSQIQDSINSTEIEPIKQGIY